MGNVIDCTHSTERIAHIVVRVILQQRGFRLMREENPYHFISSIGEKFLGITRVGNGLAFLGISKSGKCLI